MDYFIFLHAVSRAHYSSGEKQDRNASDTWIFSCHIRKSLADINTYSGPLGDANQCNNASSLIAVTIFSTCPVVPPFFLSFSFPLFSAKTWFNMVRKLVFFVVGDAWELEKAVIF